MASAQNQMFEILVKINAETAGATQGIAAVEQGADKLKTTVGQTDQATRGLSGTFDSAEKTAAKLATNALKSAENTDKLSRSTSGAAYTAMNLSRIVQDMPYGIMGVANNVDVFVESWARLTKEQGGVKAAFQSLMGSFMGPSGIMLAISAATSLAIALGPKIAEAISQGGESLDQFERKLAGLAQYKDFTLQVRIAGSEGLERMRLQLAQLVKQKAFLMDQQSKANEIAALGPAPAWWDITPGGMIRKAAINPKRSAIESRYDQADMSRAWEVYRGQGDYGDANTALLKKIRINGMSLTDEQIASIIKTNQKSLEEQIQRASIKLQESKGGGGGAPTKGGSSSAAISTAEQKIGEAAAKKSASVWESILSDIETSSLDTVDAIETARNQLFSGPVAEHAAELISQIDAAIQTAQDEITRKALEGIRAKLANNEQLSTENINYLKSVFGESFAAFIKSYADALKQMQMAIDKASGSSPKVTASSRRAAQSEERISAKEAAESAEKSGQYFQQSFQGAVDSGISSFSTQFADAVVYGHASLAEVFTSIGQAFLSQMLAAVVEIAAQMVIKSLFGFADGTVAAPPEYAIVGERGPELVRFRGGEEVVPAHETNRRLDGLYSAGVKADGVGGVNVSGLIAEVRAMKTALLRDRMNWQITSQGGYEVARVTRQAQSKILRKSGR